MHIETSKCSAEEAGVDLNRNYDFKWGNTESKSESNDECSGEIYPGKGPFSEPETQAIRDFVTLKKDELRFVYNLHQAGNFYIIPINGAIPNDADQ